MYSRYGIVVILTLLMGGIVCAQSQSETAPLYYGDPSRGFVKQIEPPYEVPKVRIRDISRAEDRDTFHTERTPKTIEQFRVHDFADVKAGSLMDADLMRIHSLGFLETDSHHHINPRENLDWQTVLTAASEAYMYTDEERTKLQTSWLEGRKIKLSQSPTRGEVLEILAKAFFLEVNPVAVHTSFADIPDDHPLAATVVAAHRNGWLIKLPPRLLKPNEPMSRVEFASVFMQAYTYAGNRKLTVLERSRQLSQTKDSISARLGNRAFEDRSAVEDHLMTRDRNADNPYRSVSPRPSQLTARQTRSARQALLQSEADIILVPTNTNSSGRAPLQKKVGTSRSATVRTQEYVDYIQ